MQLTEYQEARLQTLAEQTGIAYDDLIDACQRIVNSVKSLWEGLRVLAKQLIRYTQVCDHPVDKVGWYPPRMLMLKSQVMVRMPVLHRARSNL
ncbi:hypothetical protein [Bacillus sp. B-jedd]|uniref:hypothetical protein n=1 Tax=Bacillus sp. B-jedd TaxID=1476857 RepID=UPI000515729A|nr:hypothetical protein [Bacillus sp. B-jedd]CEG25999.1 hypothetical protein BN1002_00837 [Bacillus sp. B-jedd]